MAFIMFIMDKSTIHDTDVMKNYLTALLDHGDKVIQNFPCDIDIFFPTNSAKTEKIICFIFYFFTPIALQCESICDSGGGQRPKT